MTFDRQPEKTFSAFRIAGSDAFGDPGQLVGKASQACGY
jgi:hypothetical protein